MFEERLPTVSASIGAYLRRRVFVVGSTWRHVIVAAIHEDNLQLKVIFYQIIVAFVWRIATIMPQSQLQFGNE